MTPRAAAGAAILATACLFAAGCAAVTGVTWPAIAEPDSAAAGLGADEREHQAAARTLPVEVHFVRHDPQDPAFGAELWDHVDEQAFAADLRRRLAANGLRAGIVSGPLPAGIAPRLEPAALDPAAPEDAGLLRRLRLLPGRRAEVVAVAGMAELVLLEHADEGVRGATYRDVTSLFALHAWPDADGRVRIRIVPEVKHGALQRSWVGEEGMFRLETGQARRTFDELGMTARLPVGGMLLVGVVDEGGAAVGDALLRDRSATGGVRLLVVRPLEAAIDPLFASRNESPTDAAPDP